MTCGSKDIFRMHPISCTNTHHDITDLLNRRMAKTKKLEYPENGTSLHVPQITHLEELSFFSGSNL